MTVETNEVVPLLLLLVLLLVPPVYCYCTTKTRKQNLQANSRSACQCLVEKSERTTESVWQPFPRNSMIIKIAILGHENFWLKRFTEVAYGPSFQGVKMELIFAPWFPRYRPSFKIAMFGHETWNLKKCRKLHMHPLSTPKGWNWAYLGHPVPTGSPMGLPTFCFGFFLFFFFCRFFRRHVLCPFIVKKTTDWAETLHNHTYGHASGRGKKYFRCAHFPLSYVSKITQKNFRNS